jgi:hypothetical protein
MNSTDDKRLNEIVRLMERDDSTDAPADSIKWAKNLYRTRAAKPSMVKRLVASLQIDLAPGKAAFGERSAGSGTARQMLFNAGENAIDLRITEAAGRVSIQGQMLGEGFHAGEMTVSSSKFESTFRLDGMGQFTIDNIAKGVYTLAFRSEVREIVIEEFEV